jgi:hypothetical protein
MNAIDQKIEEKAVVLVKADATTPCLKVLGRDSIAIKAGTSFKGFIFPDDMPVAPPAGGYVAGQDYVVKVIDGSAIAAISQMVPDPSDLGGFHFAPGGNASARAGGDIDPAINPCSVWDLNFRPACPDPRGMTLVDTGGRKFWCDIYLTAADHSDITSRFGVTIADGADLPNGTGTDGKKHKAFDYPTAVAVLASHGKGLLSVEEFFAAASGVTEKSSADKNPKVTGLDAPRTSKFGLMQATGNMWVWGHDGDPDEPRASIFGGSWLSGGDAGSRYAGLDCWPESSGDNLGARGRSDHLQPG